MSAGGLGGFQVGTSGGKHPSDQEKPRVYQGVRVKTTVKELLQRHRAREASNKKVKMINQACSDVQDICGPVFPNCYVDPPSAVPTLNMSNGGARTLQLRAAAFAVPDGSCAIQMQGGALNDNQQHFGDVMLPGNGFIGNNNSDSGSGICYSASLPPPPTLPLPWCHGLSSDADYYGPDMALCSSPESLKLCSPMDHNSYSPQDSFSSSSSSCHDSPTRIESSYHGFTSEHYHYQYCNSLPHCWSVQQQNFSAPEYASYCNTTDSYACTVEENYYRKDLQMSSEMCYNVL
ncbi:colorectal cancer associated 2 [Betta splendens]|uniref:Colorectal cancer associated 2 n=1 Tax=Betta splendens TaxID=158456 RepID=A0A9W2Y7U7_BETSP|nr:colorectal cancer associated 2 [Betta splendens]